MMDPVIKLAVSEVILVLSGVLILTGAAVLYFGGGPAVFILAKVFYGIGVMFLIFNK